MTNRTPARSLEPAGTDARSSRTNARARIMEAARAVAEEDGIGHLSLDAVARRAGISKGGLLYHFPSKDALMRALVEHHVMLAERAIHAAEANAGSANALASALVQTELDGLDSHRTPPSGILAAFADNPALFDPVRDHQRRIVERVRASAGDKDLSLIAFLVLEGIKAHDVFEMDYLSAAERRHILETLAVRLRGP